MAMKHFRLVLAQDIKSLVDNQPGNAQGGAFELSLDQQVCEIGVSVFAVILVAIVPPILFSIHRLFSSRALTVRLTIRPIMFLRTGPGKLYILQIGVGFLIGV